MQSKKVYGERQVFYHIELGHNIVKETYRSTRRLPIEVMTESVIASEVKSQRDGTRLK